MKKRYLAVYDYGMGGIWGYVLASSPRDITDRYPEVEVVEHEPAWMSADIREELVRRVEDIDDPKPLGLLGLVLRERTPRPRPTNTDRLLRWHRKTRGVGWAEDTGVEMQLLDAGRMSTRISVAGTPLERAPFKTVKIERSDDDFVHAWREGDIWVAEYGPLNDEEAHSLFLDRITQER